MAQNKKFYLYSFIIFILFTIFISFAGYFGIGLLSDDYLNVFDATHSSLYDKFTGHLPFTNSLHLRPLYYLSIELSNALHNSLGLSYDNFINYRIENLVLYLILAFIAGRIILIKTEKLSLSVIAIISILIFPNNLNNACWTAARIDVLCGIFYLLTVYFTYCYLKNNKITDIIFSVLFLNAAILTKETALTIPFAAFLMCLFFFGKETVKTKKMIFITQFAVLALYFVFRLLFLHNDLREAGTLFQAAPLANIPGVIARSFIALTVPLDFLTMISYLVSRESPVMLYLACLYGAGFYLIYVMIKDEVYYFIAQLLILGFVLIVPYLYVGYVRPQMILIPFIILLIQLFSIYAKQAESNIHFKKYYLKIFYAVSLVFWCYWSFSLVTDWAYSYNKGKENVINLVNSGLENDKKNIIIGNPGRFKNTLMFDNITGSYNYWKYNDFIIKDTVVDLVQTGAIEKNGFESPLNYKIIAPNEFEISSPDSTRYFYIEGYDNERIKSGFTNKFMDIKFSDYNIFNKPLKVNLKIFSQELNCYIADRFNFLKITR